ncbi:Peptidase-S8 domain-containing protein [Aphelenchoides fujianensis]|nr:Peptidase-S8 domain-containing protein [Aphelenchoides fujianensis]
MKWVVLIVLCSLLVESTKQSDQHVLVRFNGFFDQSKRSEVLREAANFSRTIVPAERRPLHFSDFEVLKAEDAALLFAHPLIRDVQPLRTAARRPLFKAATPPSRRRFGLDIRRISTEIEAEKLWASGFTGRRIRVAIFDSGLSSKRSHLRNVMLERDYTDEAEVGDTNGHGTFTAGVIASTNRRCPGIAPDSELFVYKVFARGQESRTSWFLDAFNDALQNRVHVINLSIGGPDFTDRPFMDKVDELIAHGILFVSAIGNDGPVWGSLNNPADHPDVIGVGAIDRTGRLAAFSSRGMTSWELRDGYGRVKPDLVAPGVQVRGLSLSGGCRFSSGTSVAAPVVSGAIVLLLSSLPPSERTPQRVQPSLRLGAVRLPQLSTFEQAAGRLSLVNSFVFARDYTPQITLNPPYLDMDECPFMFPYCLQPLFSSSLPLILNLTVHSGYPSAARLKRVTIESTDVGAEKLLEIRFEHSLSFDSSGFLALFITAADSTATFSGLLEGRLRLKFELQSGESVDVFFPFRIRIVPTPAKSQRILWDQYRNLFYPLGFFPRDDLRSKGTPMEWQADHPHTNFRRLFESLRQSGYFLEVPTHPLTCTPLSNYGHLLIVDPEEEFFPEEIDLVDRAVGEGLNLIVFADWFNESLIERIQFEDPNSPATRRPETGGSNVPALNDLLAMFGFAFGDQVLEGETEVLGRRVKISSGVGLAAASADSWIAEVRLGDLVRPLLNPPHPPSLLRGAEVLSKRKVDVSAAILGVAWPAASSGFVALSGDSTCLESGSCEHVLLDLLHADRRAIEGSNLSTLPLAGLPARITNSNFAAISRVIKKVKKNRSLFRRLPFCPTRKRAGFQWTNGTMADGRLEVEQRILDLEQRARLFFANRTTAFAEDEREYADEEEGEAGISTVLTGFFHRSLFVIPFFLLLLLAWLGCLPRHGLRSRVCAPLARALRLVVY